MKVQIGDFSDIILTTESVILRYSDRYNILCVRSCTPVATLILRQFSFNLYSTVSVVFLSWCIIHG